MKLKTKDIFEGATLDLGHGYSATVETHRDDDSSPPWKREDGHGPVSSWRALESKEPGEMVLCEDRGRALFYHFAEAVRLARRDGWDSLPYGTRKGGAKAHAAAMADYEWLRRWCNDDWHYIGVTVEVYRAGQQIGSDALWGIESCPNPDNRNEYYWKEVAIEMIEGIVSNFKREIKERRFWAARGVETR